MSMFIVDGWSVWWLFLGVNMFFWLFSLVGLQRSIGAAIGFQLQNLVGVVGGSWPCGVFCLVCIYPTTIGVL